MSSTGSPGNVDIHISGTVVVNASCTFNGQRTIDVGFGDVFISQIGKGGDKQPLPFSLTCQGDPDGKTIQMQLSGDGASFDSQLLQTNAAGLGIRLLNNGDAQSLNQWFDIDPNSPPQLEVELVKQAGATFQNGQAFTAGATLKVAYN
ncbi:hypothetical protein BHU62_09335 [Serratia marcescens]|uniref:Fimbrial-type adhesion domain-containing protein n=1 Tax=Serratia marcescens TaxID=615 RepID=A0A1Q4P1L7_SERMA|nr:hypothetical protein BHU62_09335 [Serratia marcescens]